MFLIFGNFCSLLAMVTDSISASMKTTRGVLMVQSLSQVFYGASAILLKGYSAAVQNAVSLVRNFTAMQEKEYKSVKWVLIILAVILGLAFNNRGLMGLLPVAANLEYTLAVFWFKNNDRALKIAFLIMTAMFTVFNAAIYNFVGAVSNVVVIVITVAFLCRTAKKEN